MNTYKIKEIDKDKRICWGRHAWKEEALVLFWTASGLELSAKASSMQVIIETDYDVCEQWVSILINGAYISRQMLSKGLNTVQVFRGMNPEEVKNVRIVKDVQAMSDDLHASFLVREVLVEGTLEPVEERPHKIEFIGDSITSGEGLFGAKKELDWIPMFFSGVHDYAMLVSEAVDAECRVISQSGWGTLTGWDNNPHNVLPARYEKVCGVLKGPMNEELGAGKDYDFESWKADVVFVNLGTNDNSAFHEAQWKDESTGETFKQHSDENGNPIKEDLERFQKAVRDFIAKIRNYNPKAHIVWLYGMLGNDLEKAISEAVSTYKADAKDENVAFLMLPNTTDETVGSRFHPGKLSHVNAAKVIISYLENMWK